MKGKEKVLTPKQRQLEVRKRMLLSFRRYLALEGNGRHVRDHMDMNAPELRIYVESLWQPGMNWQNYRKTWCIDHIIGMKYFDVFDLYGDMRLCWNHYNLMPSFLDHNHCKGYAPEVSDKMLSMLPDVIWVRMLRERLQRHIDEFQPYYERI
jgi:hypothetical protein